jgi:hypothetical protein
MPLSNNKANSLVSVRRNEIGSVTAESDALALGTPANTISVTAWRDSQPDPQQSGIRPSVYQATKEFDLEIACDATETITSPQLFGWRLLPVTIADDAVDTVDFANNELDLTSHSYQTGDGPVQLTTSDTLPAGLATETNYYVRDIGASSIQLHTTRAGAVADTGQVAFTDGGTGTHTIVDVQSSASTDGDTRRYHWFKIVGVLSATVTVGAQQAYSERVQHSPDTDYYELVGTSGTGAQTLTIRCVPLQTVEV